jgi:hypothetical protein
VLGGSVISLHALLIWHLLAFLQLLVMLLFGSEESDRLFL